MDTSPARNFLTLTGKSLETIGLALTSVTLVYLIRLISTIACTVIEQLPNVVTHQDYQFQLFTKDFMNITHVFYLVVFLASGILTRLAGTNLGKEVFIARVERMFGYQSAKERTQ